MDIRLATALELPILESLAREIWPHTYADIITKEQMDFMLNWMYSTETLVTQQQAGHEFYILQKDSTDIGFLAIEQMKWSTQKQTRIGNVSFFGFLLMIFGFDL